MHHHKPLLNQRLSRREMLNITRCGFGSLAFMGMLGSSCKSRDKQSMDFLSQLATTPHYVPKAKNVIFLYMDGGVSQVDSFDPKPRLAKENGMDPTFKIDATQFNDNGKILQSPWAFKRYGESGMAVSELFPHIASCVDDLALIRSMVSNFPEHTNANYFLHTGSGLQGRPSMGAWINYGLGTENSNLPGYVVLDGGLVPPGGVDNFKNGFLPADYQASIMKTGETPVANIQPDSSMAAFQKDKLEFIQKMDEKDREKSDEVEAAIKNYELAYRMQSSVPELSEFASETKATQKLYGLFDEDPNTRSYGAQCLMARRLVERGVRFVELTCPYQKGIDRWDQHHGLKDGHERNAHAVDRPIAGLLKDLKSRGLLEETLVVWSGEFGRTPFAQGKDGRDHNPSAFSMWMAGAGIKGGAIYGKTDEYGYRVEENPVSIHDLHATILHLLGVDHKQLTYHFGGRDFRLTDVHGNVVREVLI
ncbi:DUF1501 domain-containing protein [Cyclobacterium jeungdonense]|uniref:DUF1501 domain-containing protein n=1 Tax=Cyclobacterium jeungdonense TaxID=708087 RepID=A0ABT8CAS7_9BACT|nr:DUF1501 domain-containing protein [Cyclobacterium jeungdonense]MDN3689890.1 DUF1501 domain-containing protein [Cyclobacterium jeungdonense]